MFSSKIGRRLPYEGKAFMCGCERGEGRYNKSVHRLTQPLVVGWDGWVGVSHYHIVDIWASLVSDIERT